MTKPVQIINNYWLKETLLNGNPILDKFYKEDLIRMINILKDENQKYKEVINKAIKYIEENKQHEYRNGNLNEYYLELNEKEMTKLLDILKEVEHEKSNN